jgi:hypothetical protein
MKGGNGEPRYSAYYPIMSAQPQRNMIAIKSLMKTG